jgi:AraC-like DNA-binding protein
MRPNATGITIFYSIQTFPLLQLFNLVFHLVMRTQRFQPVDILQPFIKTFMIIETEEGLQNNILPDTTLTMAFKLRGTITHQALAANKFPASFIAGIRKSALSVNYAKDTLNLLVIFREGAASAFFDMPLHEFAGIPLPLHDLVRTGIVQEVEERLCEAADNEERIGIIENWLIARLKNFTPDELVQYAIQKIRSSSGELRIKDLVASLPISRDPFEKKFRRIVGTSPKQFALIVRLRGLIDQYSGDHSFTDVAHRAGYYDQSHFIKDFHSFTGKTPKEYFASPYRWD